VILSSLCVYFSVENCRACKLSILDCILLRDESRSERFFLNAFFRLPD